MHTISDDLLNRWRSEEIEPFAGWDFSHLRDRMISEKPPWSYEKRARTLMAASARLLDMDTGGGEQLLKLRDAWPDLVVATETYTPNIPIAQAHLAPYGATVVTFHEEPEQRALPFARAAFDLILNRHGYYAPHAISRILKPGGRLLTKQIHGRWAWDLVAAFNAEPSYPESTPENRRRELEEAGFRTIDLKEWQGKMRFTDVGAIVYYLKASPWTVPGFSVATHLDTLLALQQRLERGDELAFEISTFMIEAEIGR